jgi:hypothetical protein
LQSLKTPVSVKNPNLTLHAQVRVTAATDGTSSAINGYTPPAATTAVVDTNALTPNTVTNTFAGDVDGSVTIPNTSANGEKFWIYASGLATVTVNLFTAGTPAVDDTITKSDGAVCMEYDTVSATYTIVRTSGNDSYTPPDFRNQIADTDTLVLNDVVNYYDGTSVTATAKLPTGTFVNGVKFWLFVGDPALEDELQDKGGIIKITDNAGTKTIIPQQAWISKETCFEYSSTSKSWKQVR